jgi:hypothetical protein
MPIVSIPDKNMVVEFPDTMSPEEIEGEILSGIYKQPLGWKHLRKEEKEMFTGPKKTVTTPFGQSEIAPVETQQRQEPSTRVGVSERMLGSRTIYYDPDFKPEGTGYDYGTAQSSGGKPDETGHWGSLDPRTGMVLKGRKHPTWNLMEEEEKVR